MSIDEIYKEANDNWSK